MDRMFWQHVVVTTLAGLQMFGFQPLDEEQQGQLVDILITVIMTVLTGAVAQGGRPNGAEIVRRY
jgi:hypothetical protein